MDLPPCLSLDRSGFEAACRSAAQTTYLGDRTILCRVLTRYLMFVDSADRGFTPHACLDGYWESWVTLALARSLRAGAYCLDIGANHGYYSLLMGEAARQGGRVLACEPYPPVAAHLGNTLRVNGLAGWCEVCPKAVTDVPGRKATLAVPVQQALNGTICRPATPRDESVTVETTTIDELTADWPRVDVIKIDAEGAEEGIWEGMRETLRRVPGPTVFMEVCPARYEGPARFLAVIEGAGFPLRAVGFDSHIRPVTAADVLARPREDTILFLRRT